VTPATVKLGWSANSIGEARGFEDSELIADVLELARIRST
jgi:hypothetical protein